MTIIFIIFDNLHITSLLQLFSIISNILLLQRFRKIFDTWRMNIDNNTKYFAHNEKRVRNDSLQSMEKIDHVEMLKERIVSD